MSEDFTEPDWLKQFEVLNGWMGVGVFCPDCETTEWFNRVTLYDLKYWAYIHLEECGK